MAWRLPLICLAVGVGTVTRAQQPAPGQLPFRTEIAIVEVVAVVTGEGDRSVMDLTAADFQLLEDGEPRRLAQVRRLTRSRPAKSGPTQAPLAGASVEQLASNRGADVSTHRKPVAVEGERTKNPKNPRNPENRPPPEASAPIVKRRRLDPQRAQVHVPLPAVVDLVIDDVEN
jgi:hypothetical protein